ncbi:MULTISPECIES: PepSY-associated TM helix domain-containing protein [Bradyrhizobium]|uniref:PepSY-associated TM helix domain-containing protein n=1 Tax=Bradyrhizobium TaxID=374 RepID=UPI00041EED95|nr:MULTISPECIES: PepSY-associated TM helix domain-containing protein [Bradyrhizobium]QOG19534.1 PepSY domain-containing protein [Bradyrhizobium sp. SEMIA]UFW50699.1 PepSY domain-containing protein [Bradyrhizobium arachidis]
MSEQAAFEERVYERKPALRRWLFVHKWSSLICTLFLLLICITGLPLVLRDEIDGLLDDALPYAQVAEGTPNVSLDRVVEASRKMYPGETIISVFVDDDEPKIMVFMASSWEAFKANRRAIHSIRFDAHTGDVLKQTKPFGEDGLTFLQLMLSLHRDLFAGLAGELFLGAMALLFIAAIVSGIAIYGPFMRKLDFGTVRAARSRRLKWLDLHNLLGVVTLGWALVVGATGVINELSTPLFALWQQTDVRAMLAPLQGKPVPQTSELSSPQAAYDTVKAAFPDMTTTSVVYPGAPFGSPFHYVVWTKGREPLTSRLFSPVLVDARSGALVAAVTMPWYLRALELSRPLHFGDYGGMPLKIIWVLLDLTTIVVLGSGVYLWFVRSRASRAQEGSAAAMPLASPGAAE